MQQDQPFGHTNQQKCTYGFGEQNKLMKNSVFYINARERGRKSQRKEKELQRHSAERDD